MYCLPVGEQYHSQVSVLHFLNRRPPTDATILLDVLLHGMVDYLFGGFAAQTGRPSGPRALPAVSYRNST
jgi:hypothetical protein